jgi:hypothetical protein
MQSLRLSQIQPEPAKAPTARASAKQSVRNKTGANKKEWCKS